MLEKYQSLRKKIIAPFVFKINPNYISFLALVFAGVAGWLFWQGRLFFAAIAVLLNGFFDILDGEIAKKYGESKFGDFLDHTFDRLADAAIFIGIAFNPAIPIWLGFGALIAVLLVSYLGTQAQALSGKRLYTAILSRADRLVILGIAGFASYFYPKIFYWAVWFILIFSVLTFFQRFYLIAKTISVPRKS